MSGLRAIPLFDNSARFAAVGPSAESNAYPQLSACNNPTPRTLDAPSQFAMVNYYRCDKCGAVWNVDKADPNGPIHIVTEGIPPQTPAQ